MKKSFITIFVFFAALSVHGQLLQVKNLLNGGGNFVATNTLLFFTDGTGSALWRSDGTEAGAFSIKSGLTSAGNLIPAGNLIYFEDMTGTSTRIWVSDGTAGGTKILSVHEGIYSMQVVGNRLAYIVFTNPGYELWTSDGTVAGTTSLTSVSFNASLAGLGNKIVFDKGSSQGSELWISDGTRSGTHLIKDINPGAGSGLGWTTEFKELNGLLFFSANDGVHGNELWRTDGTASGTTLVKDLNPGSADSRPHSFNIVGNRLFFLAETPTNGLWKTDGTTNGTVLIKSFNYPFSMFRSIVINGVLYFADQGDNTFVGLYRSDGTAAGTFVLETIDATVFSLFNVNGVLAYITHLDNMWYLYKSNGTPGGSVLITSGISDHQNAVIGKYLYYTRTYYTDDEIRDFNELGQTDLTPSGTRMLKDLYTSYNTDFENSWNLITLGNSLYFTTMKGWSPSTTILWRLTPENFLVTSFTLVNAVTDADIRRLKNYDTLYTDQKINLRADIFGNVGSVKFYVNGNPYSLENSSPFALASDNSGNYKEWDKPVGNVTVTAVPYANTGASGTAGTPFTLHLKIISPQDTLTGSVTFTLVNAVTNEDIGPLTNGQVIHLASLPTNKLNIRANSNFPGTESVSFQWQGINNFRTENTPPFSLFGDNNGDYDLWNASQGNYTLTATPYTGNNAGGTAGSSSTIHFSIVNTPAFRMSAYPNPSVNEIAIHLDQPPAESCDLVIADLNGKLYYQEQLPATTQQVNVLLDNLNMPPGIYFIKIHNTQINEFIKFTKNQQSQH